MDLTRFRTGFTGPPHGRGTCEKKKPPVKALWGDFPDFVAGHVKPPAGLWSETGRPGNLGGGGTLPFKLYCINKKSR
jgi:hypothetical protein